MENKITEQEYKDALKTVSLYEKQVKQDVANGIYTRFRCLLCGRDKFQMKQGHNCVGGFRRRRLQWEKVETPVIQ